METAREVAIQKYRDIQTKLAQLRDQIPLSTPLTLAATVDPSDDTKVEFSSTFDRELWYCCMHAVSQYRYIRYCSRSLTSSILCIHRYTTMQV